MRYHRLAFAASSLAVFATLFCLLAMTGCQKREIEEEIGNLKSSDHEVRKAAVEALVTIGRPAVDPLIAALKDDNPSVQLAAAQALGKIGDSRAVGPLIELIKTSFDLDLMFEIAVALSTIGDEKACELLREMEGKGGNFLSPVVRKRLLETGFCKRTQPAKKTP